MKEDIFLSKSKESLSEARFMSPTLLLDGKDSLSLGHTKEIRAFSFETPTKGGVKTISRFDPFLEDTSLTKKTLEDLSGNEEHEFNWVTPEESNQSLIRLRAPSCSLAPLTFVRNPQRLIFTHMSLESLLNLMSHKKMSIEEVTAEEATGYFCRFCGVSFASPFALGGHMSKNHNRDQCFRVNSRLSVKGNQERERGRYLKFFRDKRADLEM